VGYGLLVELDDIVVTEQPAARIHTPKTRWHEPVTLQFRRDGCVLCKRAPRRTVRRNCLF
jgi:hypothetical protein